MFIKFLLPFVTELGTIPQGTFAWLRRAGEINFNRQAGRYEQGHSVFTVEFKLKDKRMIFILPDSGEGRLFQEASLAEQKEHGLVCSLNDA